MEIKKISPLDNDYTKVLSSIALMPNLLYYYGKWPAERVKTVAIVGARKNSKYGEEIAFNLAKALAEKGIIVISGLAHGIDSIAARGALAGGGKTIAMLGTEIERIFPVNHTKLAEEIVARGGVVASEYHLGDVLDFKRTFLARNRLISGLADAVVVVEARERSGSLNTASHALEQGKDLFAVPGDVNRLTSQGCNRLISTGASPYLGIEDFLKCLLPHAKPRSRKAREEQISLFADTDEEREILTLLAGNLRDGDLIMEKLDMDVPTFNQTITMLEIKGAVQSLGNNYWTLA